MANKKKYTDEALALAVRTSTSFRQVLLQIGLRPYGGNYASIQYAIARQRLSTSHFLPMAGHNKGKKGKPSANKRGPEDLLRMLQPGEINVNSKALRRCAREGGIPYRCACGNSGEWLGQSLVLDLDHRDGNRSNNERSNLRFLCPNCHSQTPTFRNRRRGEKQKRVCTCGNAMSARSKTCIRCRRHHGNIQPTKITWPPNAVLLKAKSSRGVLPLAKVLGVSETAVRKRIAKITRVP